MNPYLSILVPVYNEEESLPKLFPQIFSAIEPTGWRYEILCVDDASTDRSLVILKQYQSTTPHLRVFRLRQHSGKTPALAAAFAHAQGELVVTLDADLQNDPQDIPRLVKHLNDGGYDVVSGWRKNRQDPWVRRIPSRIANRFLAKMTGVTVQDSGCMLKAYRRQVVQDITPYGDMHRLLPAYMAALGYRIGEMEVHHRPRQYGQAKYGLERTVRVFFDILAVSFVIRHSQTPLRIFGGIGLILLSIGSAIACWVVFRVLWLGGIWISPMIFLATIFFIAGIQFVALGLLAEMLLWMRAAHPQRQAFPAELIEDPQRIQTGA